jgi:protein TonB
LRLKSSIGYRALDENTIEVIKTAYKDYPRPSKKTKIMFYVTYKIYGI